MHERYARVGDCRDLFNVTVALFDAANTVVEKFERQVELDFSGLRTFDFTDTVQENSFSVLTGSLSYSAWMPGFTLDFSVRNSRNLQLRLRMNRL